MIFILKASIFLLPFLYHVTGQQQISKGHGSPSSFEECPQPKLLPSEYEYQYSSTSKDEERHLAYFREDIAVNIHHVAFHSAHPFNYILKNYTNYRRGEFFFYYHQQVVARYDAGRLAHGLPRVLPYGDDFSEPIKEGIFDKLPAESTPYKYPGRSANLIPADVELVTVRQMEMWRNNINKAIEDGFAIAENNSRVSLAFPEDINLLCDILESATNSINPKLYGTYHNRGHVVFGKIHDPDGKYGTDDGPMYRISTSSRDPLFFRWHKHIDNMILSFKDKFDPYTYDELNWEGITLNGISVRGKDTKTANELTTFTKKWKVTLQHGIDFQIKIRHPILFIFSSLDHEKFEFKLDVFSEYPQPRKAVVRIYIAPIFDENNIKIELKEQRRLFIQLDNYKTTIMPGQNELHRSSDDSTVTVPLNETLLMLETYPDAISFWPPNIAHPVCGWPDNLLIPKGNDKRMPFVLFASVSTWERTEQNLDKEQDFSYNSCLCGNYNEKYPDARALGYPFDRRLPEGSTWDSFLTPNMAISEMRIFHSSQIVPIDGHFDAKNKTEKRDIPQTNSL